MTRQLELFSATGTLHNVEARPLHENRRIRYCTLCNCISLLHRKGLHVFLGDGTVPSINGCMLSQIVRKRVLCRKNKKQCQTRFREEFSRKRMGQLQK